MRRDVQTSELIFLGLLILIAAYLFLVHIPVTNQMNDLEEREAALQDQIVLLNTKVGSYNTMKAAVDKVFEEANGNPRAIPAYNNISVVTLELHRIFSTSVNYSITFGSEAVDKTIVRRDISITFTETSYDSTIDKISQINESANLYLIKTMTITPTNTGGYVVSLSLTNFEYKQA